MTREELFKAVGEGEVENLRHLLKKSTDTKDYEDLLFLALDRNFPEVVMLLLENKADPNARDAQDKVPLFYAVSYSKIHIPLITSLLHHKANPDIQNCAGKTALHLSAQLVDGELAELLLENKANPNIPDDYGETPIFHTRDPAIFTLFLEHNADIDFKNKAGDSIRDLLEAPSLLLYSSHLRNALNNYLTQQLQNIKVADEDVCVTEPDNQASLFAEENASNMEQDIS